MNKDYLTSNKVYSIKSMLTKYKNRFNKSKKYFNITYFGPDLTLILFIAYFTRSINSWDTNFEH
jgi:hypothetical protein